MQPNIVVPPNRFVVLFELFVVQNYNILFRWTHLLVTYNAPRREACVYRDGEYSTTLPVQGQLEANGKNLAIRILAVV